MRSTKIRLLVIPLLILIMMSSSDNARQSNIDLAVGKHSFSITYWEITNISKKWLHLAWELFPGNKPTDEERIEIVNEYLEVTRMLLKETDLLENESKSINYREKSQYTSQRESEIRKLEKTKNVLQARAEEAIEAVMSDVLRKQGLGFRANILFPPTDFRLETPPLILVTSPRNKITLKESKLVKNGIKPDIKEQIEKRVEEDNITSALVDDLAGLGTYPAFVSDKYDLRQIVRTAAHEWLHNYWIFHSFGRNMWDSPEMYTLNETAADIAGNELGDLAFIRLGGTIQNNSSKYSSAELSHPHLTRILRETRQTVESLLIQGEIEEAEKLMRESQWTLKLGGYSIRKINQAYFAFRGNYAESPASTSQIGAELKEYRGLFNTTGEFVKSLTKIKSYEQFKQVLEVDKK